MQLQQHLDGFSRAVDAFADSATSAGLDAAVPTTPDWDVRRLVAHQGLVHRWATGHLLGDRVDADAIEAEGLAQDDPVTWLRAGAGRLLATIEEAPDELTTVVTLATAAAAPFLSKEVHGRRVAIVSGCYAGEPEDGGKAFRALKEFGTPIADLIGPMPYAEMQRLVDGQWAPGFHNYFKSWCLPGLDDEAVEALVGAHERVASLETKIQLYHFGGAVGRVARDETAFAQRDAAYLLNVAARWTDPSESDIHIGWARELHAAMTPSANGGVYVNFLGEEGHDRIKAAYGEPTYTRLVDLKQSYDPTNFFRVNQNIPPKGTGAPHERIRWWAPGDSNPEPAD